MSGPLVGYDELISRPGFDGVDQTHAEALLADASALVRQAAAGALDDVEPPDTPGAVQAVVVNMVRRGLANPRGLAQESLGDYSYTAGGQQSAASLYLTGRERRIIRAAAGRLGVGAAELDGYLPLRRHHRRFEDEFLDSL